jgi:hypothetical protein
MYMERFLPDGYTVMAEAKRPAESPRAIESI